MLNQFQDEALMTIMLKARQAEQSDPLQARVLSLLHRWKALQYPDTAQKMAANPLTNFSERTLVELAQRAGFEAIHMQFHIDVETFPMPSWEVFVSLAPHPLAPTLKSILRDHFTVEEQIILEGVLRPAIERGDATGTTRMAYLQAKNPD